LAVAGFACMNVMLLSVSVWSGAGRDARSVPLAVGGDRHSGDPLCGAGVLCLGLGALKHGRTNMDVPISIGVLLATALVYETLTHGVEAWFDGTLMLLLFLLAGRVLDAMMRDRARAGVDALLRQAATGAMVVARDNSVQWLPARDLLAGMVIRVGAGERLAADGVIVAGTHGWTRAC
jgi:Cu2+-exporting ATPase